MCCATYFAARKAFCPRAGDGERDFLRVPWPACSSSRPTTPTATTPILGEKRDPTNHPVLGGGPVIKVNANCKYMTDADMLRLFRSRCEVAGRAVP